MHYPGQILLVTRYLNSVSSVCYLYLVGELIWQYSPVSDHVGRFGEGLVSAVDSSLDEMSQSTVVEVIEHVGDCVQLTKPSTLQKIKFLS